MKRTIFALALVAPLTLSLSAARGTIKVGDQADPKFVAADGTSFMLDKLHGKLVVIDFWATWCGPCMHEAPHMVQINQKYGPQGLQMLGVSLDSGPAEMQAVAAKVGFTWPQHLDLDKQYSQAFGVDSIPRTFLLGPDGTVLWTGHPAAGLDAAIEQAMKDHPPQLVDPKALAEGNAALDEVEKKIDAGDEASAIKLLGKVPTAAKADPNFVARADGVRKKLETAAATMLSDVDPLIEKGDYAQAVARLKELSDALSGLPIGGKARAKLTSLMADPKAKAALAAAERNAKADDALAVAQKLAADKKNEMAYTRFKAIVRDFAGTGAAATAAEAVKAYEQDPSFVKRATDTASAAKARAALSMAESYRRAGNLDAARAKYQGVIADFPNTSYADTAKEALSHMASE